MSFSANKLKYVILCVCICIPPIFYVSAYLLVPNYLFSFTLPFNALFLVLSFFVSPILEEIVFRGFLQDLLNKRIGNQILVVILVNFVFALLHVHINPELWYLLLVFACGVLFSSIKILFKKIRYPILLHSYYNISFLLLILLLKIQ